MDLQDILDTYEDKPLPLDLLPLVPIAKGAHSYRRNGVCIMEAVAWVQNQEHTDAPRCVSPAITGLMIFFNDSLDSDEDRSRLLAPLIPDIVNTNTYSTSHEFERRILALDWVVREVVPAFLDLHPSLSSYADTLRQLAPISLNQACQAISLLDSALTDTWRLIADTPDEALIFSALTSRTIATSGAGLVWEVIPFVSLDLTNLGRRAADLLETFIPLLLPPPPASYAGGPLPDSINAVIATLQTGYQGLIRRMADVGRV